MKESRHDTGPWRRDARLHDDSKDPYLARAKPASPSVCPDCGAVFEQGRWAWGRAPDGAAEIRCPACRRIADHYPAGYVTLAGGFLAGHRDEILGLVRNAEADASAEHPLNRIMAISDADGGIEVTTTDIHLPRRIGEALRRAYEGELDYHYEEDEHRIRVSWTRDA